MTSPSPKQPPRRLDSMENITNGQPPHSPTDESRNLSETILYNAQEQAEATHVEIAKTFEDVRNKDNISLKESTLMIILNNRLEYIKHIRKTLFLKYAYLRHMTILFQVSVILASTTITFMESLTGNIPVQESRIKITSIILSTYIAISTSIFKFLKIDDKKEEIYKLMEVFSNHEKIMNSKKDKIKMINSRRSDNAKYGLDASMNYRAEFYDVYREIEEENIINNLYESVARYDSVISYKEKMYYKGKIVENLLLENVHDANHSFLINERYKYETTNENQYVYGNNFCNNLCLYFSYFCHFCLVMQLYYFLDSHQRKTRNEEERQRREQATYKNNKICSIHDLNDKSYCCCCTLLSFDECFGKNMPSESDPEMGMEHEEFGNTRHFEYRPTITNGNKQSIIIVDQDTNTHDGSGAPEQKQDDSNV